MNKMQREKKIFLLTSLFLLIIFSLLSHVHFARAEEPGDISPNANSNLFTLITGQSISNTYTQNTPFALKAVGIISIGNSDLTASLSGEMSGPDVISGFWWIYLLATGGGVDSAVGSAPSGSGAEATLAVDPSSSFGLAILGVYLTSPVSSEDPVENINLLLESTSAP